MKLSSSSHQLLESSNILSHSRSRHRNDDAVTLARMLSSHCDNMLPYAPGRRAAAVLLDHRRYRPNNVVEVAPSCPRCDSPNTKFCYYNNYSLSQPRYFCKGCRRYWTKGGSLRNVPVGGGCRKNRRGKPVVRAMAVDSAAVAAASGGAASSFAHRSSSSSPATLRPDLLLEGMIGSPISLCQQPTTDDAAGNPAVPPEGSTIDLALLYAKFLNHQPAAAAEPCAAAVVPEPLDTLSASSSGDVSPVVVPPRGHHHQPFTTQADDGGFGELSASAAASAEPSAAPPQCPDDACAEAALGAFSVDPRCYDSLGLPPDGGDLVLPSTWHLGGDKYEPFDPLPEDAMSLQDGFAGDDDVWSSALACQGLEAALCRP